MLFTVQHQQRQRMAPPPRRRGRMAVHEPATGKRTESGSGRTRTMPLPTLLPLPPKPPGIVHELRVANAKEQQ